MSALTAEPLLRLTGIHKRYPGVHALKGVGLDVRPGEVHAVVGENGAGKSTLMQILAGVHQPDGGEIYFDGVTRSGFASERASQAAGVAMVFQERSLFAPLSVADNVFAGRQPTRLGVIRHHLLRTQTAALLARVGLVIDPDEPVEHLSPGEQQLVEIAKALSLDARLLILDEPTAALTDRETRTLFAVLRELRTAGVAIIYISHRLEEVLELADRVTVLKDGEGQGTFAIKDVTSASLIRKMVGRDIAFDRPAAPAVSTRNVFEVRNLHDTSSTGRVRLRDISFQVAAGEILGIAGLVGAGRSETMLGVFGAREGCRAEVSVDGQRMMIDSPRTAIAAGIGCVPEDRKDAGLFLDMGMAANIATASLRQFGFWLRQSDLDRTASEYQRTLSISARGGDEPVGLLSGGNQQKVLLARWLLVNPKVFMVDEPTRGIDVGAKREVHAVLFELARRGRAVVVISSDLPELMALADRVIVLREGRMVGELAREAMTEESIMGLSSVPV